ncbi:hypothetical protein, partial [uncultured Mailhella sp.]|uniref:hypothetical protein n=1 Tax=uncultured Mailhella sp. TaxID=1981031 RepID=UPI0025E81596
FFHFCRAGDESPVMSQQKLVINLKKSLVTPINVCILEIGLFIQLVKVIGEKSYEGAGDQWEPP